MAANPYEISENINKYIRGDQVLMRNLSYANTDMKSQEKYDAHILHWKEHINQVHHLRNLNDVPDKIKEQVRRRLKTQAEVNLSEATILALDNLDIKQDNEHAKSMGLYLANFQKQGYYSLETLATQHAADKEVKKATSADDQQSFSTKHAMC